MTPPPKTPAVLESATAAGSAGRPIRRFADFLPLLILAIGWSICGWLLYSAIETQRQADAASFARLVSNAEAEIHQRVATYVDILYAGASFLRASPQVTREQWREFSDSLDFVDRYPGIDGIGVIFPVSDSQLETFAEKMRADRGGPFTVHYPPPGSGATDGGHAVISFIEPESINAKALGLDVFAEPHRRAAALASRDLGEPRLTQRISLVQDGQNRPGFLLYVPVYRGRRHPATIEERQREHIAWVYAPFVLEELLTGALGSRSGRLDFWLHDGGAIGGETLLFSSTGGPMRGKGEIETTLELAGVSFAVAWQRGRDFVPTPHNLQRWLAATGAMGFLLLAGLIASLQASGRRAQAIAVERTRALALAQSRQRAVLDGATFSLISTTPDGVIVLFNVGAEKMLGYTASEMVGKLTPSILHLPREIETRAAELSASMGRPVAAGFEAFVAIARLGQVDEREWTYVRKDGRHLPVLLTITAQRDEQGEITGFLGVAQDMTDRKRAERALVTSEARLDHVLSRADCLVWEADISLNGVDWVWDFTLHPSGLADRLFGSRDATLQVGLWNRYDVPDHPEMNRRSRHALENGAPGYAQDFRLNQNGRTLWLRESVALTAKGSGYFWAVGVVTDITEQTRAEAEAQISGERLTSIFNSAAYGIVLQNVEGAIEECNTSAERILGLSRREMSGRSLLKAGWRHIREDGTEFPSEMHPLAVALKTGQPIRDIVMGVRRADESLIWILVNAQPIGDASGAVQSAVCSFTDITARKLAEEKLRQSQSLLENVTRTLPGMVAYWTASLHCAFSNHEYLEWFGKTSEQMRGIGMQDLLGEELFRANERYVRGALQGIPQHFERKLIKVNGDVRQTWAQYIPDFTDDGKTVNGFVVLVSDITETKLQEQALRSSEARLRASLQEVTNLRTALDAHAIVSTTDRAGTITFVNDRFCTISKHGRGELLGQNHRVIKSSHHPAEFFDRMWATISHGRIWNGEICNRAKDGSTYWVEATIVPFLGENGRPVQYIGIRTDITERKRLEESLAAARDQALEASRLKSEFLATMSHEIRTPMNGVLGMAAMLMTTTLSREQRQMSEVIENSAESLLVVINDILDFSKIEAGRMRIDPTRFDLRRVVEETAMLLAPRAHEKGLELMCEYPPRPAELLLGDSGRIRQVLVNLVGNAIKFTDTGEVQISVVIRDESAENLSARVEIRDTGVGIPPESRRLLFQPFVQVDGSMSRRFGGTGLGLAISRQLVELMNGEIGFTSEAGAGSTFWFEIKLPRFGTPPTSTRIAPLTGRRVLLVEDNVTNCAIVSRQLVRCGLTVESVAGGAEAIARLRDPDRPAFDVGIIDSHLPDKGSQDLAAVVRGDPALGNVPLILLSAATSAHDPDGALTGFAAVLTKPVREDQLHRCLASVLLQIALPDPALETTVPFAVIRTLHLLVAEDNLANQSVAKMLLSRMGHSVEVVNNGAQALAVLGTKHFDAVLMDCQMPVLNGFEATRRIRTGEVAGLDPAIPIIALTAYARPEDRTRCLDAGMDDYVSKPLRPSVLAEALRRHWPTLAAGAPPAAETALGATQATFDEQALANARSLPGIDGPSLLPELVTIYLREEPERLHELRRLLTDRQGDELADSVHAFAGNAASFGGARVRQVALEVERAARARDWPAVESQYVELQAACARLRDALAELKLIKS